MFNCQSYIKIQDISSIIMFYIIVKYMSAKSLHNVHCLLYIHITATVTMSIVAV